MGMRLVPYSTALIEVVIKRLAPSNEKDMQSTISETSAKSLWCMVYIYPRIARNSWCQFNVNGV